MMDPDRVVAASDKPLYNHICIFMREIVRPETEIHSIEALLHSGQLLKLEMSAYSLEP